jgi:hypothetical protein
VFTDLNCLVMHSGPYDHMLIRVVSG